MAGVARRLLARAVLAVAGGRCPICRERVRHLPAHLFIDHAGDR